MFKTMATVLDKVKDPSNEQISKISSFVFTRWLQNNPNTVQVANKINQYYNIPIINQYYMVKYLLPNKRMYIKYPKVQKNEGKEDEILAQYLNIGLSTVEEYKQFMTADEIKTIIEDYERLNP